MPFVKIPKDLADVKTKVAFNLTKRQLICFALAGGIGFPSYLLTRNILGSTGAVFVLILTTLPCFFFAMYEKNGQPFEKILKNFIKFRFKKPDVRPYKTNNLYSAIEKQIQLDKEVEHLAKAETKSNFAKEQKTLTKKTKTTYRNR